MRVCVVGTALNPVPTDAAWSGIESLVTYMVKGLVEIGVDVTLVSFHGSLWRNWDKIDLIEVPVTDPDLEKSFYNGYKDKIRDFDCVIDNSNGKLARLANKKVIQVSHWLQHPLSMGFRNVVCISKAHAKWTKQQYPKEIRGSPQVVYNGIDPSMFPFSAEKGDEYLFFSVLGPYKGADTVLQLALEMSQYRFGFGGRNTDYTRIVQEAAKTHPNITCYGEVSHEEKKKIMGRSRALLQLPKPYNPREQFPFLDIFPMTIVEANLCGTPVIGLNEGGVSEMIEQYTNGILCKDLDEVRRAISVLSTSPAESPIDDCLRVRKYAESRFNHIRMAREYLKLAERVIAGDWW